MQILRGGGALQCVEYIGTCRSTGYLLCNSRFTTGYAFLQKIGLQWDIFFAENRFTAGIAFFQRQVFNGLFCLLKQKSNP